MRGAAQRSALVAWAADDRRWYLDLVAQSDGGFCSVDAVPNALHRCESMPWDQCILLEGDGDTRITDTRDALWSDDRHGRWFETRSKPLVWLHVQIGQLRYGGRRCANGEVASHICGSCHCIRLEHIVHQSVREDRLDRAHHKEYPGSIRLEHVPKHLAAILSPVSVIGADLA